MSWFAHLPAHELPDGTLLIDVRSTAEYMGGHLDGAINLPLPQFESELPHRAPNRDTPIVVYCASGARSEQALGVMQHQGYTQARNGGGANDLARQLKRQIKTGL